MHFVIIGNGIAGMTAAFTMRGLAKDALITVVSRESHPSYSACVLPDYISGEITRERVFIRTFLDYSRHNIDLKTACEVLAIDPERRRVVMDSGLLHFDRLIIATGSKPILPKIEGIEKEGVFTIKSLDDADGIFRHDGQSAVVVGSGPIGVEACIALKNRGYRVILVELLDRILPQVFDKGPASIITGILQKGGIEVSAGERVLEILGVRRVEGVVTNLRKIGCDTLVIAAGMRPDVHLGRNLVDLGRSGGILVDEKMSTNFDGVYACGDCVETRSLISGEPGLSLLWPHARKQGEVAGSNAAGVAKTYAGSIDITGIDLFGHQAVSVGLTGAAVVDGLEVIERKGNGWYQRLILSNGVLVGAQSIDHSENMGPLLAAIIRRGKNKGILNSHGKWEVRPSFRFHEKCLESAAVGKMGAEYPET
jgi:NADPH-dependent 2,4-dienoyl-CoA reductase/sulfur reductase-like enzyme